MKSSSRLENGWFQGSSLKGHKCNTKEICWKSGAPALAILGGIWGEILGIWPKFQWNSLEFLGQPREFGWQSGDTCLAILGGICGKILGIWPKFQRNSLEFLGQPREFGWTSAAVPWQFSVESEGNYWEFDRNSSGIPGNFM